MKPYFRKPFYYETDQMGVIHHSNYIRLMEEARLDLLFQLGFSYFDLEKQGIVSPVTKIDCEYLCMATLECLFKVIISIKKYTGVILAEEYIIINDYTDEILARGVTQHCFIRKGTNDVLRVERDIPILHELIIRFMKDGYQLSEADI